MTGVADVFRRFAEGYLTAHGAGLLPSHRRAIDDILACRTQALGGHLWRCVPCGKEVYSYHSCRNRGCPACHTDQAERWLKARQAELLPCRCCAQVARSAIARLKNFAQVARSAIARLKNFHITVTVPEELREALRSNQKAAYPLLMKAAAQAIIELCRDRRHLGGTPGLLAVLHTWTQELLYHPHVHCLVTGGGVQDGSWHPARGDFLLPYPALAKLVRGKLMAMLAKHCPGLGVPKTAWQKPWVVHCTPWGQGADAVLRYLARYVFRTAISNSRIEALDADSVIFRHKHRASNRWRRTRLSGHEFMRRFLQHVLPSALK